MNRPEVQTDDKLAVLDALRERTKAIEPSREFLARLHAIPQARGASSWGVFVSAIAHYAVPSLALAGAIALVLAWVSPSAELAFDDELTSAVAMEVAP